MNKKYIVKKTILILLLIVLMLLFFSYCIAPSLFVSFSYSRLKTAEVEIEYLMMALDAFKLEIGRYPTSKEGLEALIICPSTINKDIWKGPYLKRKKVPRDPWGKIINYRYDSFNKRVLLYSYGQDGISMSEGNDLDDINNWDEKDKSERYNEGRKWHKKIICLILIFFIILDIYILIKLKKTKDIK